MGSKVNLLSLSDMSSKESVLVIDAGNTSIKVARFQEDELIEVQRFTLDELSEFDTFLASINCKKAVLSSVLSSVDTKKITDRIDCFIVDTKTKTPLDIHYSSSTLGIDRICNAVATYTKITTKHGVSIDIGTCVKFDLVDNEGNYFGGSISPGIDLRYKSLNDYTGNLPLLSNKSTTDLVGTSTETSIRSGVMNGLNAEIARLMESYSHQFESLTFFVTGGDAKHFDIHSKNDIFADENLTLLGLYEIYKHNA